MAALIMERFILPVVNMHSDDGRQLREVTSERVERACRVWWPPRE
jgi:hypothetical protein